VTSGPRLPIPPLPNALAWYERAVAGPPRAFPQGRDLLVCCDRAPPSRPRRPKLLVAAPAHENAAFVTDARHSARTVADPGVAAVLDWWTANARQLPWRTSRDVYAIWVSEVMSTQTTVNRAAEAWVRWMERWPTVDALAAASLADVLAEWQGLGYPRRARDLHRSARIVMDSGWPQDLTDLPGVGAYVAAAVRCFALEEPVLPLDVNVKRVLRRRFPEGADISADPWRVGQAIMEFGQQICAARPMCEMCPVSDGCGGSGDPADWPVTRQQKPFEGSLRQRRGRLLREVIAGGVVAIEDADPEAAAGLVDDGLVVLGDGRLLAPT
jgi:A/G-specific adenine glycosylase